MAIDIEVEQLITCYGGKKLPTRPSPNTIRKWITEGCASKATGETVRLEHVQIGGRIYTSVEAYSRYIAKLSGHDDQGETRCRTCGHDSSSSDPSNP